MIQRIYNFSAGPAVLPKSVLKRAAKELENYEGTGQSVMEMSHRSKEFKAILSEAKRKLTLLLNIPENYEILFLQGGASLQFAMLPLNLLNETKSADYVITGIWAQKAYEEACRFGHMKMIASSKKQHFTDIPNAEEINPRKEASYVHITFNNTIVGTCYSKIPDTGDIPLIADVSSYLLSEPLDVKKFGAIYAGAQKNMGIAGVTIVIIRKDLIKDTLNDVPTLLQYQTHVKHQSLYHTPPAYNIYISKLVFDWLLEMGGLVEMQKINTKKASLFYSFLQSSKLFTSAVKKEVRSKMNIPFQTGSPALDEKFIKESSECGFLNLKGHRSVGGMRASFYNAMPVQGVEDLIAFMEKFEKKYR